MQRRIVVILGASEKELKSVHYALSLAERLEANVLIIQQVGGADPDDPHIAWVREALSDLIDSARQAGLTVSYHISGGELVKDIMALAEGESVDVLVFSDSKAVGKRFLREIKLLTASQIIQVKGRNRVNYIGKQV